MAPMNLLMKQKQTYGHREQTCGSSGRGLEEDWRRKLELADANYHI